MERGIVDYSLERNFWFLWIVGAISVSRFDHQIIAGRRGNRIANDRLVILPQVSRKQDAVHLSIRLNVSQYLTRAEDMTGNAKLRADAFYYLDGLAVVLYYLEKFQCRLCVFLGVKRESGSVTCYLVSISIVRFFLLETSRVGKQNAQEIGSTT
jgi:hypothetical protein